MTKLQLDIIRVVDDRSGGVKFMTLIADLSSEKHFLDPDDLEDEVLSIPELAVLKYVTISGREKIFVHRVGA